MLPLRKLLTSSLLAAYAGIAMLGQGLHLLTPDCHHNHIRVVQGAALCQGNHCCHDCDDDVPSDFAISAVDHAHHDHDCQICQFLVRAVTEPPHVATTPDLHVLVAQLPCESRGLYTSAILGLHTARGPPQSLVG